MKPSELHAMKYLEYIEDKQKVADFYRQRYSRGAVQMVEMVLFVRANYQSIKSDSQIASQMFHTALALGEVVQQKFFENYQAHFSRIG